MTHRIMLMADTHGRTDFAVEPTGLVIHAGDLTRLGDLDELEEQAKWLAWIPAERVVVIAEVELLGGGRAAVDPHAAERQIYGLLHADRGQVPPHDGHCGSHA